MASRQGGAAPSALWLVAPSVTETHPESGTRWRCERPTGARAVVRAEVARSLFPCGSRWQCARALRQSPWPSFQFLAAVTVSARTLMSYHSEIFKLAGESNPYRSNVTLSIWD